MRQQCACRMNRTRPVVVSALLLLTFSALACTVSAEEQRYSLGTIQEDTDLVVTAGEFVVTRIGFYNIDGTVPAVVALSASDVPQGWEVTLSRDVPSDVDAAVDASAQLSLEVEPGETSPERTSCEHSLQQSRYLLDRGYVCADIVYVSVAVPEDAPSAEGQSVRVDVVVTWPSVSAQLRQEREFTFAVAVLPPARVEMPWWSVVLPVVLILVILYFTRRWLVKSGYL
ncbi:MAG: hypothetical protein JW846_05110 [Dehalococcoidia bacterium]|nr:hypothetical protein [Dehalococcoidia bacterium]